MKKILIYRCQFIGENGIKDIHDGFLTLH